MEYIDYLNEIVMRANHAFLLDDEKIRRGEYLKSLASNSLFEPNSDKSLAIYLDYEDLVCKVENDDWDKFYIELLNKRYFDLCILEELITKYLDCLNRHDEIKGISSDIINRIFISSHYRVQSSAEYLKLIREEKAKLYQKCQEFLQFGPRVGVNYFKSPACFVLFENIIRHIKIALNNSGHVALIIDKQSDFSISLMQYINGYINARSNRNLAIKVGCGVDEWRTFEDNEHHFIGAPHDFSRVDMTMYLKRNR